MDFDAIYNEYHDKVMRYILKNNLNPFESEDICQNVFIKIMNNMDKIDLNKASLSTWIYTITQNTVYTHFRTKSRYTKRVLSIGDNSDGFNPLEEIGYVDTSFDKILNDETLNELASALEKLEERTRNLIIYIYYDGMTMKAAAEKHSISYANAKILIKKGFAALKAAFN